MKKPGLYHFAQVIVPVFFKLLYRYRIIGRENIPEDIGVMLCANHTSYKDPVFLGLTCKRQVHFMAKQELFKNRFFSWLIRKLGAFPVARSGGASAIRHGIDIVKSKGVVGIFIEGTRSKDGQFLNPKPGVILLAAETGAPIVPIDIIGADGRPPRIFRRSIVRIGKPVPLEELGLEDVTGASMRKASRLVMTRIKALREATVKEYTVS